MGTLYFVALFGVLFAELNAVPPSVFPPQQRPQVTGGAPVREQGPVREQVREQGQREEADGERPQINSVTVKCHPDSLEIMIQADLFGVGASVKGSDLRLGVGNDKHCKAILSSNDEFRITAGLLDCGTKHWMIEESLVYTNLLIYSPAPPAGGVIRMEEAVIPVECHYERKYSLTSSALLPTWIPFVATMATMEKLNFALKIMTPDWLYKRSSNVFYLGDSINIEASVRPGHHMGLRVFLSSCVATITPDEHSLPRYVFVEDGCLLDSQVPTSRSQFLSRGQDDKLYLVIDAFRFHNENRGELYITCQMNAVPVNNADSPNKACTFINGRWRSADSNDYLCGYCHTQNEEGHIPDKLSSQFSPRGFGRPVKPETLWRSGLKAKQERNKEAIVGPLVVLSVEQATEPEINLHRYGSTWRSGVLKNAVENELVPDELSSPEEDTESIPLDVTDSDADYASENETSEEDTENGFVSSEKDDSEFQFKVKEVLENETTASPSDVSTTLLPTVVDVTAPLNALTASLNNTDSDFSVTKEPKR